VHAVITLFATVAVYPVIHDAHTLAEPAAPQVENVAHPANALPKQTVALLLPALSAPSHVFVDPVPTFVNAVQAVVHVNVLVSIFFVVSEHELQTPEAALPDT